MQEGNRILLDHTYCVGSYTRHSSRIVVLNSRQLFQQFQGVNVRSGVLPFDGGLFTVGLYGLFMLARLEDRLWAQAITDALH